MSNPENFDDGMTQVIEDQQTLCNYDKKRCCNCMTKSIKSEDGTHMVCEKCGATK